MVLPYLQHTGIRYCTYQTVPAQVCAAVLLFLNVSQHPKCAKVSCISCSVSLAYSVYCRRLEACGKTHGISRREKLGTDTGCVGRRWVNILHHRGDQAQLLTCWVGFDYGTGPPIRSMELRNPGSFLLTLKISGVRNGTEMFQRGTKRRNEQHETVR